MLRRTIAILFAFSLLFGSLVTLPAMAANCPMQMGTSGCHEVETQIAKPCCCEIDREPVPANSSQSTASLPSAASLALLPVASGSQALWVADSPVPRDRQSSTVPDLLSLHSVLRL